MSREIKFRAWDDHHKEMIIPYAHLDNETLHFWGEDLTNKPYYPSAVMQYTGLKDKNGKEIYEGDVLCLENKYTYDVRFTDGQFTCFHLNTHGIKGVKWGPLYRFFDPDFVKYHTEVIGNVYENPELLKQ